MLPEQYRLKNTIKYPTSLIIGGLSKLGLEIADSLIEQGGYVIIVDTYTDENVHKLDVFPKDALISFLDYTAIPHLEEDLRRLDYVFYFSHDASDYTARVSTQQFLTISNYLDATLALTSKFEAKFLLTTAIRAHQLVLSSQEMNLNFGVNNAAKHTIYSEMEIQKYSESLVMEYVEKTKLDARIIRLGEMIGDGIDFGRNSTFVELIMSAAKRQPLKLKKDGLETEWYVHLLDAAYGIIKAQFSRNTVGEIYSLCYETAYTNLAVAYKIQEFDNDAQDIIFIDEKDNLPPLKLYKPAPNLTQIGWTSKIPFDKAVRQSLAAAKIYLLENETGIRKGKGTIVDKLKGFLAIADSAAPVTGKEGEGAVSRLIVERKKQEELRRQSLEYANSTIKTKKRRRVRTAREKIQFFFWKIFLSIGNNFSFLKNKTPVQFALMLIGLAIFVLFYINIASPLIVIGRDISIVYPELSRAKSSLNSLDFVSLNKSSNLIDFYLSDTENALSKFEVLSNVVALRPNYDQFMNTLKAYELYNQGVKNISFALSPFSDYVSKYQNNTQVRSATDSYLSITAQGVDYSATLNDLNMREPYLDDGINKINEAVSDLNNINMSKIPSFAATYLSKIQNDLSSIADGTKNLQSAKYLGEILGLSSPQTYLVLLLDNTKPTPAGGDISAFAFFTVKNGSVSEIVVQSPDEVKFDYTSIDDVILKEINNRRFVDRTKANVTLADISTIKDYPMFSDVVKKVFEDTYSRKIAGVITLNYSAMDNINRALVSSGTTIQLNDVKFNGDFLQNLNLSLNTNESVEGKHIASAQVLAQLINSELGNLKQNLPSLMSSATNSAKSKDVLVSAPDLYYSKYIELADLDASQASDANLTVNPAVNATDLKVVTSDKYPSYGIASEVIVQDSLALSYKMDFKFPAIGTNQEVSVCLPLFVSDSSITVQKIPTERVAINFGSKEKCVVMQTINEEDAIISWSTPSIGSSTSNNSFALNLALSKIRGANMTSDFKIAPGGSLTLSSIKPDVSILNNIAIFTQTLLSDQFIQLQFTK